MKTVPILVTWDVDPDIHIALEQRQQSINAAVELCCDLGIPSTFFVTARVEHISRQQLERMLECGQEIGCHGLTHKTDEDYHQMPEAKQRDYISAAKEQLETWLGAPIHSFRSPRVKTSALTLKLLSEYGYLADSSICSQRIDFISSNLINRGWITAPRLPYQPCHDNPFKRGDLPIWEIPVSALVLPFISSSLRVVGLRLMKLFYRLLYAESRRNGKPIVYLAHPTEFVGKQHRRIKREHFSPSFIRTHGFRLRNYLYRMDGETCLGHTRALFSYMGALPGATFMTVDQYVNHYLAIDTS
jgi:hypothetical protein